MQEEEFQKTLIATGIEERVSVNQRALVDKLLARYKGEYTVFRELIQNADDAKATHTEIAINSEKKKTIVLTNNGNLFSETDWQRLIKIAEGNPNEDAIGCFGVGFYSVFSLTDNPMVQSGNQSLVFCWDRDQLTTYRSSSLQTSPNGSKQTSFIFPLRDSKWKIDTKKFALFLCKTLAFTQTLQTITLIENEKILFTITRNTTESSSIKLSKNLTSTKSPEGLFKLESVEKKHLVFRIEPLNKIDVQMLHLELVEGKLEVCSHKEVENQMTRVLGKRFPRQTKVRLLFPSVDSTNQHMTNFITDDSEAQPMDIETLPNTLSDELSPFPNRGRIFIGFSSHQTTGAGFHVAAQLIPTVERENIDFSDQYFKLWNEDLLFIAGKLARLFYDQEMGAMTSKSNKEATSNHHDNTLFFTPKRLQLINILPFEKSTPSPEVSELISTAFLESQPLLIPSTTGICPSTEVYLPYHGMEQFVSLPMIPVSVSKNKLSMGFFEHLKSKRLIGILSFKILTDNLHEKVLSSSEVASLLQWYCSMLSKKDKKLVVESKKWKRNLMSKVSFRGDAAADDIILLSNVMYIVDKDYEHVPLPPDTLPYSIIQHFTDHKIIKDTLQLIPLPVMHWWNHIEKNKKPHFLEHPSYASKILVLLSKLWSNLNTKEKHSITEVLQEKKCVLTEDEQHKQVLKKPKECYMRKVSSFGDLPLVAEELANVASNKFLKDIGVRSAPDAKLVFSKLGELQWSVKELVDFLMKNQKAFDDSDWEYLKSKEFLPSRTNLMNSELRCKPSECHFPNEIVERMSLRVLDWNGSLSMMQRTFLKQIGVRESPSLKELLNLAASSDERRRVALQYFFEHFESEYKEEYSTLKEVPAFVPTLNGLKVPRECFHGDLSYHYSAAQCRLISDYFDAFEVMREFKSNAQKIGIKEHVSIDQIIDKLVSSPVTKEQSFVVFDYVAKFQSKFTPEHWKTLKCSQFIPNGNNEWVLPSQVLLPSQTTNHKKYEHLLEYAEGYSEEAQNFLKMCGCVDHPTHIQLVEGLLKNSRKFLETSGEKRYLQVLHELAMQFNHIPIKHRLTLRDSPVMLGYINADNHLTENSKKNRGKEEEENEERVRLKRVKLCKAEDCYLIDNADYQKMFEVLSAPAIGSEVDSMYENLGSVWITSRVKEKSKEVGKGKVTEKTKELEQLVNTRSALLLHDLNSCRERENLKDNAEEVLQNLSILEVEKIKKEIVLGEQKREMEAVICSKNIKTPRPVIYVTNKVDILALSSELATILLVKKGKEDTLKFSAILQTSLASLRQQGYPIDRLLASFRSSTDSSEEVNSSPVVTEVEPSEIPENDARNSTQSRVNEKKKKTNIAADFKKLKSVLNKAVSKVPKNRADTIRSISNTILETRCEQQYDKNLTQIATTSNGVCIYEEEETKMKSDMLETAEAFSVVLKNLSDVFAIKNFTRTVSIFVDDTTGTVAFNMDGELHFNLLYYDKLHYHNKDSTKIDEYFFWFHTFCHELAHNLVVAHNEDHSWFTDNFACTYFKKVFPILMDVFVDNGRGGNSVAQRKTRAQSQKLEESKEMEGLNMMELPKKEPARVTRSTSNNSKKRKTTDGVAKMPQSKIPCIIID